MRYFYSGVLLTISLLFSACVPLLTSAAGIGGSAAVGNVMNGTTTRTFTAPAAKVHLATKRALNRMKIKVMSEDMQNRKNIILLIAKTPERNIEIQIEPISNNATRMKVEAKGSLFSYDNATAEEIILQTKKSLG